MCFVYTNPSKIGLHLGYLMGNSACRFSYLICSTDTIPKSKSNKCDLGHNAASHC